MRQWTRVSLAFLALAALCLAPLTPRSNASQRYGYRSYGYRYSSRPIYRGYAYRYRSYYRPYYRPYGSLHYRYWPSFYWPSFYRPSFAFSWGYPAPYANLTYSYYAGGAVDYSYRNGSVRTDVEPKQTEVYVDEYYAGIVDDFDGTFQRLYVPPGQHEVLLRLEGYRVHRQTLHVNSGTTYKIHHDMEPLGPGEKTPPAPQPSPEESRYEPERAEPEPDRYEVPPPSREDVVREPETRSPPIQERTPPEFQSSRPPARFGMLALQIQPADAQIVIDGELWGSSEGMEKLVIHLPTGRHRVAIRKEGFQTFETDVDIRPGETAPLNVKLDGARM